MKYGDVRDNGMVGVLELEGLAGTSIHFSEWWNGEGIDVLINDTQRLSLHMDDIEGLVTIALALQYVDLEHVQEQATQLLKISRERKEKIEGIRNMSKTRERQLYVVDKDTE